MGLVPGPNGPVEHIICPPSSDKCGKTCKCKAAGCKCPGCSGARQERSK